VPGFKPVHLGFGQILQISFSSRPSEEDIVLRPENDGFRLSLPKKSLPLSLGGEPVLINTKARRN
jgi:hypothetical protein